MSYEGWQPIETAPKDGTAVLLCSPLGELAGDDGQPGWHVATGQWGSFSIFGHDDLGYWCDNGSGQLHLPCEPSLWQPLPAPPA